MFRRFTAFFLAAALTTAVWAGAAQAATSKKALAEETQAASEEDVQAETASDAPVQTEPAVDTGDAFLTGETAVGRMEGDGFAMPEDAAAAYIRGLQENDLNAMLSAFAVETYAEKYSITKMIERVGTYTPTFRYLPNISPFSLQLNVEVRRSEIMNSIRSQYLVLTQAGQLSEEYLMKPVPMGDKSAQEITDLLFAADDTPYLSNIRFENEFISPMVLSSNYMNQHNLANIGKQAETIGANAMMSVAAKLYVNDVPYLLTMDTVQYGRKWYVASFPGNIGMILGIDSAHAGLISFDEVPG